MPPDRTVRRLKNYPSAQGRVYQYYFVGQRAALADDPEAPAVEFVFDVVVDPIRDEPPTYAVSVFLPQKSFAAWADAHSRTPSGPEQYGAAKLRLLQAFDELGDVREKGRRLSIDAVSLEEFLAELNVD